MLIILLCVAGLHIGGDCANIRQLKLDIRFQRWRKVLDWLEKLSDADLSAFAEESSGDLGTTTVGGMSAASDSVGLMWEHTNSNYRRDDSGMSTIEFLATVLTRHLF